MSASTSESPGHGNRVIGRNTSGWTAFDLKQKRKQQGVESYNGSEAYPLLSSPSAPKSLLNKNGVLLEKPFSSVVVASMNFPSLTDTQNSNLQKPAPVSNSHLVTAENIETAVTIKDYQKLKYLHSWADESLIQDVLAGVNNNVLEALSLLDSMVISENKYANAKEVKSNEDHFASFEVQGTSLGEKGDISFTTNDTFNNSYKEPKDDEAPSMQLLDAVKFLLIEPEPEWEEDDVYLIHRKDAIRMTRSASRHSKAANDAYIRGDHASARHFSLKAQEDWTAAEKLNAKAAKDILAVRNHKNDLWTLDLHGLHSAEAVEALRERLQTMESLVKSNHLATPNGVHKESGMSLAASVQSTTPFKMEKFGRQHPSTRQRSRLLQVITGNGNHSRGAASLPSAIRNFLNENGYHFDETRPGVIMMRPKFRQ